MTCQLSEAMQGPSRGERDRSVMGMARVQLQATCSCVPSSQFLHMCTRSWPCRALWICSVLSCCVHGQFLIADAAVHSVSGAVFVNVH
jgi:hypothetical protein